MCTYPFFKKPSYTLLGCLLSVNALATIDSGQENEPDVVETVLPAPPVVTAVSDDTDNGGDGVTRDTTLQILGTAEANAVVEVTVDGVAIGTTIANGDGQWLFDHTEIELEPGKHVITATAIDATGHTTAPSNAFNLTINAASSPQKPLPSVSNSTSSTTPTASLKMDLVVAFGGSGEGSVTSKPKGITCSSKTGGCRYTFEGQDLTITLQPIAAADSRFTNWGGHGDCADGKISTLGSGQKFCLAYFTQNTPEKLTLSVEKTGSGNGSVKAEGIDCGEDCREVYVKDQKLSLTAQADKNSQFEGWEKDCSGNTTETTLTVNVEKICVARFSALEPQPTASPSEPQQKPVQNQVADTDEEVADDNTAVTVEEVPPVENQPTTSESVDLNETLDSSNGDTVPETPTTIENTVADSNVVATDEEQPVDSKVENSRLCPPKRLLDYTCDAQWQTVADLKIVDSGPGGLGNLSNAIVTGTLYNQGWVSNLIIKPSGKVIGGVVSGSVSNQGLMVDFEFRGERIYGGTLAGRIKNTSKLDGVIENVMLTAGTHLSGGRVSGTISGDAKEPALLENLTVLPNTELKNVTLGNQVKLSEGVKFDENTQAAESESTQSDATIQTAEAETVKPECNSAHLSACTTQKTCQTAGGQFTEGVCLPHVAITPSQENTVSPPQCALLTYQHACEAIDGAFVEGQCKLLPTCKNQGITLEPSGEKVASTTTLSCGLAVGQGSYTRIAHLYPEQPMSIRCNVHVDPTHVGQPANLVAFGCYEGVRTWLNQCAIEFCWMMDNQDGKVDVLAWDRTPATLVPFKKNVILTERLSEELFSGVFKAAGHLTIFFGYQLDKGDIIFNLHPLDVTVHSTEWGWW